MRAIFFRGGALGDLILTLPALRALRSIADYVCLVAPDPQRVLARSYVDQSFDLNSAGLAPLFGPDQKRAANTFASLGEFDLVLSYLADPNRVFAENLAFATSARLVQGPFKLDEGNRHAVFQLAAPVVALGATLANPYPEIPVARTLPQDNLAAIHIGSSSPKKNWPIQNWVEFSEWLRNRFDRVLLVSGEADTEGTDLFLQKAGTSSLELLSDMALEQLAESLAACRFFVGHDSGVTHLAAAVGIITLTLFGPTNPQVWRPLTERGGALRCAHLQDLTVDRVTRAAMQLVGIGE